jgi:hypothetical protein
MQHNLSFKVDLWRGSKPVFTGLTFDSRLITDGLGLVPSAASFVIGADGRDYVYFFPSLFYRDPQLPGLEFVRSKSGSFEFTRFLSDISMGAARDFALIKDAFGGPRFVIVDHGSEYANTNYSSWPFGHVWVATDSGSGFQFQKISDVAAFNHAVSVGDLNADGRMDIVTSHMGVKEGGVSTDLHAYLQQTDGRFLQDKNFAQSIKGSWGSGAVVVANVNQNTDIEVIQVNYLPQSGGQDWGGIRILGRSNSGAYEPILTMSREGLFTTMGATQVNPFDFDLDGDLDLAVSLEGRYGDLSGTYTGNGLEIFQNNGKGVFTRLTADLMIRNSWSFAELQFREFEVVDFDGDGFQDIVLNGWGGKTTQSGKNWDLSSQFFKNVDGKKFLQLSLSDASGLSLSDLAYSTSFVRTVNSYSSGVELFMMQKDGAPITARIQPLYRNQDETLIAKGINTAINGYGGNDLFAMQGSNLKIDGGAGIDTAIYSGTASQYQITTGTQAAVVDKTTGRDGTDSLTNVERLKFSDTNVALDVGPTQNAGSVYMLYKAAFNRAPDASGMGYWLAQKDGGSNIVTNIAQGFVNPAEFIGKYGSNPTNLSYVNNLYQNVLGRTGEAVGVAYWIGEMDAGRVSKSQALVQFATLAEGASLVAPLIANGIQYQEWVG